MRLLSPPAIATLGLCLTASAWAARPLVTDDPGVLDRGSCELEAVLAHDHVPGESRVRGRSLQLGCGFGLRSQAAVAVVGEGSGAERSRGLALVGKTALGASDGALPWALAWGLGWQRAPGEGWRHAETTASLLLSREVWAGGSLSVNLGHAHDAPARQGRTTWGLGVEQAAGGTLAVAGEFYGDDRGAPWWNLGLRWTLLPERLSLDASYGQQITGGRPQRLTLGAKFSF
jgi:hypothetical protein